MAVKKRTYANEPLGPAIERLMAETGVTYRALAEKTGLSAGYLNHIVHGNRRVPSSAVIGRIAKALGVKPDYFREGRSSHGRLEERRVRRGVGLERARSDAGQVMPE